FAPISELRASYSELFAPISELRAPYAELFARRLRLLSPMASTNPTESVTNKDFDPSFTLPCQISPYGCALPPPYKFLKLHKLVHALIDTVLLHIIQKVLIK